MIAKTTLAQFSLIFLGLMLTLSGCEDKHHERYEDPPWLGGSNIESLMQLTEDGEGSYNYFLELMDSAGYRDPIEKSLFTLFVPNDSAFEEYFKIAGISGIQDLSKKRGIGIVYASYSA
ncbi:MAG: hypothetical protein HC906_01770 [Bacteroidales bacterium]|nr:hypothetical protein [Bacteroidales bacterium]